MPINKLKKFLDDNEIPYVVITHSQAFTAQQVAASAHISGKDIAKTVMIKVNCEMAMAVLPGPYLIDFSLLKEAIGIDDIRLAGEREFKELFPDCQNGAMPPFGNLYGMKVYVAKELAEDHQIAFNAGTHTQLVQLAYKDFERMVKPQILEFSVKEGVL